MPTQLECPLTIEWETLPENLRPRVITAYSLDSAFMTSTDSWSVTIYDTDPERLRHLALEPVILNIHGKPQLLGRVDKINRGRNGNEVTISGRDHLSTIVECNIDPTVKVTEDNTLAQAIVLAAGPCGIDTVFGESDVQLRNLRSGAPLRAGKDQGFAKLDPGNLKPEAGVGIYEWLNTLASRQGCTIQPGPTRASVVLAAPNYEQDPSYTFHRSRDPRPAIRNNITSATADEDYSMFPTVGLATGKVTASGEAAKNAAKEYDIMEAIRIIAFGLAVKLDGKLLSKRILPTAAPSDPLKLYRFLYVKDDQARKQEQVERAITRAVSERLRETLNYSVTLKGHTDPDSGHVYAIDTIAAVRDEVADIDENLWICQRRFSFARGTGAETELTMWRPGSFIL